MASSDAFRFLRQQYLDSLATEDISHSSDPISAKFKSIGEILKASTNPESLSSLYDLNDALTGWRILKEQNKSIKRLFSFREPAQMKEQSGVFSSKLDVLQKLVREASSRQAKLPLWDRYTFYKPQAIICIEDVVSVEQEKQMTDWLRTSGDDFKAVGIHGMGGSGKTTLVQNVLKQKSVTDKFKPIIWACLSQLHCEEEVDDVWIVKYLLYRLGLDTDSLMGNIDKNKDRLMEELECRLHKSRNYILVLDDMWHCSNSFVDNFLGRLKKNGGGAVIVTSRRKSVAEKIGDKNKVIHLKSREPFGKDETKDLGK